MDGMVILISLLVLATVPAFFIKRHFKNVEVQSILCMFRTKKGLRILDRLARYKTFWNIFSDSGIIFAFGIPAAFYLFYKSGRNPRDLLRIGLEYAAFIVFAIEFIIPSFVIQFGITEPAFYLLLFALGIGPFMVVALILSAYDIFLKYATGVSPAPAVTLILPGLDIPGSPITVPFHAIVGLILLLIVHELSHGIVARVQKIRVKSMGILTAGVIPIGAFTEPDEGQLKRVDALKRMRVFAAGSTANFVSFIVLLGLAFSLFSIAAPSFVQDPTAKMPSFIPAGSQYAEYVLITGVYNGSNAQSAGLLPGMKMYNADLIYGERSVGDTETFITDQGNITIQRDAQGVFGFTYDIVQNYAAYDANIWFEKYLLEIVYWSFTLNLLVGLINLMPFFIFDGARLMEDLVHFYMRLAGAKDGKHARRIVRATGYFILFLLVLNALPWFIK